MDNDLQKGLTFGTGRLLVQALLDSQLILGSNDFTKFLMTLKEKKKNRLKFVNYLSPPQ